MPILPQVQADAAYALRSGDRERAAALRLVVSELQKAAKEPTAGAADEVAVLRRERKRRLEAAEAYAEAGRADLAEGERLEAELIEAYLPAELSESELEGLVADAVAESGATSPKEIGRVMSLVMPRVEGRADGRRVSAVVREKLQGAAA
ncbi:MAG: GatB/YqeY domain-containing protein [Actinomycetota bacterium]|nr:GatB/YqeY domain-containing protein [Actinomycetota bacterium]